MWNQRLCTGRRHRTPCKGEEKAASTLETRARKRANAEKQRAAEAKAARLEALIEQDRERQQRLAAEELQNAADRRDLAECLKSSMGLASKWRESRMWSEEHQRAHGGASIRTKLHEAIGNCDVDLI